MLYHFYLPIHPHHTLAVPSQVETALSQGIDPLKEGFSLVLKKNGRIGARSKGCPPWGTLVSDVKNRELRGLDTKNI